MDPISNFNDTPGLPVNAVPTRARIARMAAGVALTLILALVAGACNKAESEAPSEKGKGRAAKGGQDKGKGEKGKGEKGKGGAAKNRPSKEEQEAQRKQIGNVLVPDKTGLRNQLAPNATTEYKGARLSTNQWGMRDKDYQLTPPPGTKRIAILGSAQVFGGGVKDGETFEQLVEDRLNREVSPRSGLKFEVLNFGVVNYTLMQQAIILSNGRVGVFQPDAVMIVGHQGDLRAISDYVWRELQAGRNLPAPVDQVVRKAAVTRDMEQPAALKKLLPFAEDLAALALKDAAAEIRRMGAEPVFAIIPTPARRIAQKEFQLLIELAKAAGFAVLNLTDVFTKADFAKLVLGKTDPQPNAEGHKVIAGRLYDGLTRMPAVLAADSEATAKRKTAARAAWNRELPARKKAAEDSAAKLAKADKPSVPPVPIEGWTVEAPDGGAATLESSRKDNWLRISISRLPKSSSSTIKVRKAPVAITSGQRYVLTLWLKAEANRPVGCRVADGAAPGGPLGESTELKAVTWWQEFSCTFTATGTKKDAQILLDLGANQTALELSNIQLKNLTTGQVVYSTDPAWRGPARAPK